MKKTTTILLSLVLIVFAIGGCTGGGFRKTKSGIMYKIISSANGPVVKKGEFIKVHFTQKVRDSVINTSFNGLPTYAPVDSIGPIYSPAEVFTSLKKGDSVIIVMLADSLVKKQGALPPFMKKEDKVTLIIKVLDVFDSETDVRNDQAKLLEQQKSKEIDVIQKYLDDHNIKAEKTPKGVFVQIENKGDGPACDSGKTVHVMYKGETFGGKVFDTNMDTTFGHAQPFVFTVGQRGAIEGWDDGMRVLNKGGKAKMYIPSMLAYGSNPPPGAPFKAYENLIFDVQVLDVTQGEPRPSRMPMNMPPMPKPQPSNPQTQKPAEPNKAK